jgi:hypothetical protein
VCSCHLDFSSSSLRCSFLVTKSFKVHTWLSWVLRSSEGVRACYSWSLTAPRRSMWLGGSWWALGDCGSLKTSLVYTVRDPSFRRWGTCTLSEHLCLSDCWRKICTLRQAHSKPNKLASHANRFQDVTVNFPWKLTKDKVVKFQSLELAGWYQTVPYLRLESQVRWHIAIKSYLPAN